MTEELRTIEGAQKVIDALLDELKTAHSLNRVLDLALESVKRERDDLKMCFLSNAFAKLDFTGAKANANGCAPCPFCKSRFRWVGKTKTGIKAVMCDSCGLLQPIEDC